MRAVMPFSAPRILFELSECSSHLSLLLLLRPEWMLLSCSNVSKIACMLAETTSAFRKRWESSFAVVGIFPGFFWPQARVWRPSSTRLLQYGHQLSQSSTTQAPGTRCTGAIRRGSRTKIHWLVQDRPSGRARPLVHPTNFRRVCRGTLLPGLRRRRDRAQRVQNPCPSGR